MRGIPRVRKSETSIWFLVLSRHLSDDTTLVQECVLGIAQILPEVGSVSRSHDGRHTSNSFSQSDAIMQRLERQGGAEIAQNSPRLPVTAYLVSLDGVVDVVDGAVKLLLGVCLNLADLPPEIKPSGTRQLIHARLVIFEAIG